MDVSTHVLLDIVGFNFIDSNRSITINDIQILPKIPSNNQQNFSILLVALKQRSKLPTIVSLRVPCITFQNEPILLHEFGHYLTTRSTSNKVCVVAIYWYTMLNRYYKLCLIKLLIIENYMLERESIPPKGFNVVINLNSPFTRL